MLGGRDRWRGYGVLVLCGIDRTHPVDSIRKAQNVREKMYQLAVVNVRHVVFISSSSRLMSLGGETRNLFVLMDTGL